MDVGLASGASLAAVAPEFELILAGRFSHPRLYAESEIARKTALVAMRDGVQLSTDLYLPPRPPAPAIATRTPYGRATRASSYVAIARRGYVVLSQDCRGTGDSEPDQWDFGIFEAEDSIDFVDWMTGQEWFSGFLGGVGGSYVGWTQWCMAMHPSMSAIAPEMAGVGILPTTRPSFHMFVNAYSRSVGKGADKVPIAREELERRMLDETLASGYFNQPLYAPFSRALLERFPHLISMPPARAQRSLYNRYSRLPPAERADVIKLALGESEVTLVGLEALSRVFGHTIPLDAHVLPRSHDSELLQALHAPALLVTGWYDWGLDDTLATWESLVREAADPVRSKSRLFIAPSAHNKPGYREGRDGHPELEHGYRTEHIVDLLLHWYGTVRADTLDSWPTVVYYLMGANEWCAASSWPLSDAEICPLYLAPDARLTPVRPNRRRGPDRYVYDPDDPTPTVGGSILSYVYTPGSVDVSGVQQRADVLSYTTGPLSGHLDVVGPLRLILYASSSAVDTDFSVRLSDVFPDGRAIQLQSGTLRARYRSRTGAPELLEPSRVYRFDIEVCATANRFAAGHRLRVDISSADFPKFDRNTNRGGERGPPVAAEQSVYHDADRPSRLLLPVVGGATPAAW